MRAALLFAAGLAVGLGIGLSLTVHDPGPAVALAACVASMVGGAIVGRSFSAQRRQQIVVPGVSVSFGPHLVNIAVARYQGGRR